ncbi:MAG: glycoside hydrolase family 99-like domain-containing protein, partial [Planctomycetes bacterium]|nr:glycoside hydrolase family 99-like domain-containing protein [Planctomycetota bacterium]
MGRMRLAAYVYTGWHPIPERDAAFHPGFTEWELVRACRPRFPGHNQPRVPQLGEYDDRDPREFGRRIALARSHGVDALVFGVFWCRGKRVFEQGLERGFFAGEFGTTMPFACMWANRMPR